MSFYHHYFGREERWLLLAVALVFQGHVVFADSVSSPAFDAEAHAQVCKCGPDCRHASCCCGRLAAAVPLVALQAEPGLDPEGGGALVLSHTGEGHGPNSPSGLAHGDQYWSLHPGGANFLFADGSVRFIKELVGFSIFQAIATRAGGEVLSADQF